MRLGRVLYKPLPHAINTVWGFIHCVCWIKNPDEAGGLSPRSIVWYFGALGCSLSVCQGSTCKSILSSTWPASSSTLSLRDLAVQLRCRLECRLSDRALLANLSFIECVHPQPSMSFQVLLMRWVTCLLAAFKILFVFWLINIDGLGVGSLNGSCLGFVERHTLLLNGFCQLWDISVLSFLTTCILSQSSALGIPPHALDGNSQVSETIRFSVLFLSLGLPKQIYFVGFTAHHLFF